MRSRYSAYVMTDEDYLLQSWHPQTRPQQIQFDTKMKWFYLRIKSTEAGRAQDDLGEVVFEARYRLNGKAHKLKERSAFVKENGVWFYLQAEE